jgi:hypothetical protein
MAKRKKRKLNIEQLDLSKKWGELRCFVKISISCSRGGARRATFAKNLITVESMMWLW